MFEVRLCLIVFVVCAAIEGYIYIAYSQLPSLIGYGCGFAGGAALALAFCQVQQIKPPFIILWHRRVSLALALRELRRFRFPITITVKWPRRPTRPAMTLDEAYRVVGHSVFDERGL